MIVTGGRDRADRDTILRTLDEFTPALGETLVVVHGACLTGADRIAQDWCAQMFGGVVVEEPHPADWETYGRRAGPIRNQRMVSLGADLVLAFPGKGRGTWGTVAMARKAGIPVRIVSV